MSSETRRYTSAHWGTYKFDGAGLQSVDDDPFPAPAGQGWWSAAGHAPSRVARPSFRRGWLENRDRARSGDAEFVELPWDEALDITAQEFERVIATHGNDAIFGGSYGWSSAGRFHHAQSQLARFLNSIGGYIEKRETYSHAGAEVLFPHVFGLPFRTMMGQATTWPQIVSHARVILAFGGLTPRTSQIASGGVGRHHVEGYVNDLLGRGARLINISPQASDLDGGEWLSIRPGSDRALMLALAHTLFSDGLADLEFLDRCTAGWQLWRGEVADKTPEWASPLCDIAADQIRQLAHDLASNPSMITVAYSLQRADRGEETLWAAINLAATLGQIGKPGTGFAFGPASMNSSSRPTLTRNWPALPRGARAVDAFIPVARITEALERPGGSYLYNGRTWQYPEIKMICWSGGNPFHHHQDLFRLEKAWQNPETVLVTDHAWTATARRADIVLPATTPLEREDIMMQYRENRIVYMSALRSPYGEARDDYAIFSGLAARLGAEGRFTDGRSVDDWLRLMWEEARGMSEGLPDFETFRAQGIVDAPNSHEERDFLSGFVADPDAAKLSTPSGKIEVASQTIGGFDLPDLGATPSWTSPREWLGDADDEMLHLISPQPNLRLHAQNDAGDASQAAKVQGREPCYLHPETAAARGVRAGDVVVLSNVRGRCLAGVVLHQGLRRDCIALATGAWMDVVMLDDGPLEVHGNPNVLTYDAGTTSLSQGNPAHTALVSVQKWDRPLPPVTVFDGPRFVTR